MNTNLLALPTELPTESAQPASAHEHGWLTESAHRTSEGVIRYVRCTDCGARRVDLQKNSSTPAIAIATPEHSRSLR